MPSATVTVLVAKVLVDKVDKEMKQNKEVASGKLGSSLNNQWKGRSGLNKIWRFVISTHLAHKSSKSEAGKGVERSREPEQELA